LGHATEPDMQNLLSSHVPLILSFVKDHAYVLSIFKTICPLKVFILGGAGEGATKKCDFWMVYTVDGFRNAGTGPIYS
jgi:hypothetical protein